MKRLISIMSVIILLSAFLSSNVIAGIFSKSIKPETYGIYLVFNKKLIELEKVEIKWVGNLMNAITGIRDISKITINDPGAYITLYDKELPYNNLILSKLKFQGVGIIDNIFSRDIINVSMWVPEDDIELKVAPIKGEDDMYRLIPSKPLVDGVYAIHFGGLHEKSTVSAIEKKMSYNFIFGEDKYHAIFNPDGVEVKDGVYYIVEIRPTSVSLSRVRV